MLVEHIIAKRQQKKALAATEHQPIPQEQAVREERRWVDEKQELGMRENRNVSRETVGTELPSYGQAMKGM